MTLYHSLTPRNCPPNSATHPNGIYFRFVFNNPPNSKDFTIWVLEPENEHKLEERMGKADCNSFAISILAEEGVARKRDLFLNALKKKAQKRGSDFIGLARLHLDPESGVFEQTGSDPYHFDLWPFTSCKLECNVISVDSI